MEVRYISEPMLNDPVLVAAWPGMGYLAKISADYMRRRLRAKLFAEITYYQNAIVYKDSLAELPPIKHRFYAVNKRNLIICVGDAQPSTPEEAMRLASIVLDVAERYNVKRIYTMAAYPNDYEEEPRVYGVYTEEGLRDELESHGVGFIEGEGAVNGLNGILIGVAKSRGIEGVCLMGEIRYANVPQHISSKAVLERLTAILGLEIDTTQLVRRAEKIDASIRKSLGDYQELEEPEKKKKAFRYIS
jgi:proteasome assembly chaperone (PAC2) family protein